MILSSRRLRQGSSPTFEQFEQSSIGVAPSSSQGNNGTHGPQTSYSSLQNSGQSTISPISYMREYPCFSLTLLLVIISSYTFLYVGWSSQIGLISRSFPSLSDMIFSNSNPTNGQQYAANTNDLQDRYPGLVNVEGQALLRDDTLKQNPPTMSYVPPDPSHVTSPPVLTGHVPVTSTTSTISTTLTVSETTATSATPTPSTAMADSGLAGFSPQVVPTTTVPATTETKQTTTTVTATTAPMPTVITTLATTTTMTTTTTTATTATVLAKGPDKQASEGNGIAPDRRGEDEFRPERHRRTVFHQDVPECAQKGGRAKTFLVVFMGHSGSSAILSELWSIPDIMIENPEAVDHGELHLNTTLALEYTRDYFERGVKLGRIPGFKIRPLHLLKEPAKWANLLREFETRVIWQYRRNKVKQAVGEYSVQALNDLSSVEGLKSAEEVKERCKTGAGCSFQVKNMTLFHHILVDSVRSDYLITEATEYMTRGRECLFELRYEDYLYHRKGTMRDLQEFLGLPLVETEPERFKATGDSMCDVVENWTELCENFYGCPLWRHYFEDTHNGCSCPFSSARWEFCQTDMP